MRRVLLRSRLDRIERLEIKARSGLVAEILERRLPAERQPESLEQTLARVVELQRTEFGRRLLCGQVRTGSLAMTAEVQDRLRAIGAGWLVEFATRWAACEAAAQTESAERC